MTPPSDPARRMPRANVMMPLGVLVMAAGGAAAIAPQISTVAVSFVVGLPLLFYGVLEGINALVTRGQRIFTLRLALALVAVVAGGLLLAKPGGTVVSLVIIVAAYFVLGGLFKIVLAFQLRPMEGWGFLVLAGGLSLLLAAVILLRLSQVPEWVVGVLVGVDLIIAGWWLVSAAQAARRRRREET